MEAGAGGAVLSDDMAETQTIIDDHAISPVFEADTHLRDAELREVDTESLVDEHYDDQDPRFNITSD
eukprot:13029230-Heterocapsa_arctica.AAC.1